MNNFKFMIKNEALDPPGAHRLFRFASKVGAAPSSSVPFVPFVKTTKLVTLLDHPVLTIEVLNNPGQTTRTLLKSTAGSINFRWKVIKLAALH